MVKVLRSFVGGPLESYVEGFAEELRRRGYSRSSAEQHVCFVAHLDGWMRAAGVGVVDLREPVIERYLEQRRAAGYVEYRSVRALRPLLDHLESLGVLPPPQPAPLGPVDALLERYRGYLLSERHRADGAWVRGGGPALPGGSGVRRRSGPGGIDRRGGDRVRGGRLPAAGHRLGETDRVRAAFAADLSARHG
ncbi:MAG TPA: hypothetical protein VKP64_09015 [Mycobacteriales bacterium]|nr:hypothetical protein [Mycobacteriales bacterium]